MISIDSALGTLGSLLNDHFRSAFAIAEDLVLITSVVEPDGSLNVQATDKLVVQLFDVAAASDARNRAQPVGFAGAQNALGSELPLDLRVMIMANLPGNNYPEGLKIISHVIAFIEDHPVLDHGNTPKLSAEIDSLRLVWENLELADMHRIMDMLGTRYLPAISCKIRVTPGVPTTAGS